MEPKVSYDPAGDVLYIRFSDDRADKSIELGHGVIVHLCKGTPVGVTIIDRYEGQPPQE